MNRGGCITLFCSEFLDKLLDLRRRSSEKYSDGNALVWAEFPVGKRGPQWA